MQTAQVIQTVPPRPGGMTGTDGPRTPSDEAGASTRLACQLRAGRYRYLRERRAHADSPTTRFVTVPNRVVRVAKRRPPYRFNGSMKPSIARRLSWSSTIHHRSGRASNLIDIVPHCGSRHGRIIGLMLKIRAKTMRGFKALRKVQAHPYLAGYLRGDDQGRCDLRNVV